MNLKWTVALICIYGVLKKFRPGIPFLTPYLESVDYKNFTNEQLYGEIYPYWTYSNLISQLPLFFLTDLLRYKPVIVLEAVSLCATWAVLVFGISVKHMQFMQILYGISTSADVAYQSYLYAVVDKQQYKKITSYVRSSTKVGKFLAYSIGQLLVSTGFGNLLLLHQITFAVFILLVPISLILPNVNKSKEEYEEEEASSEELQEKSEVEDSPKKNGCGNHLKSNMIKIWECCKDKTIFNFIQTLWSLRHSKGAPMANGLVESLNTLAAALCTFSLQYSNFEWHAYGGLTSAISSLSIAAMLLFMVWMENIYVDYALYMVISCIYYTLIAVASNLIATHLKTNSYGLIFGLNTFVALFLQCILTYAVADVNGWWALDIEAQFVVYGGYFFVTALVFTLLLILLEGSSKKMPKNVRGGLIRGSRRPVPYSHCVPIY
ncbi:reduced folate carrier domain-containing protein [Ditylenchus destructor]|uniref:Reduced folate carrier domain-containing protein n=1 Tax=Ditylenchus destructor TaxID=166010 RepID=A0AAD4MSM3_9BILA|nr:reduced folate carrier domain-containing protein [Ditylenchus destructor]